MNNSQHQKPPTKQHQSLSNEAPSQQQKPVRERPTKLDQQLKKKKKVHLSFEAQQPEDDQTYKVTKNPLLNKENTTSKLQQTRKTSNAQNLQEIIKAEYLQKVQKLKQELIQFQYRYWEGGELIKKLRRKKKQKVRDLLEACRIELVSSFKELAQLTTDDLLFVIKDFIIPHEMTLYEIEALELKTKKNELLMNLRNVKIKKEGKQINFSVNIDPPLRIIERIKYEKNKQAYPFCNWENLKIINSSPK